MSFWERNFIVIGASSLIAGAFYFGWLALTWQETGDVPAPQFWIIVIYIGLQFGLSAMGIIAWDYSSTQPSVDTGRLNGMDERDRLINMKTEAGSSHVYYVLTFATILFWFRHENTYLLIHSLVGAYFLGDLFRSILQVFNYNRAY